MNTPDSQAIIERFFEALYYLKSANVIKGKKTFTDRYDIDRWNFNKLEKDFSRDIFQVAWLSYLINDYGISARWLLTGNGNMLSRIQ